MWKASALQLVLLALVIHWQIDSITTTNILCGQRPIAAPGTITYGRSSWPGQFPWHVALYRTEQPLTISYACGGFIVGERVVITAAHCVTAPSGYQLAADELTVRVGLYDLLTLARHSQEHRVGRIHRHGNFTTGSPRHDLALLMLRTIVEFGDFVQPICLPREPDALKGVRTGTVSGWGLVEDDSPARTLRSATMPVVSYLSCLQSDSTLFGPVLYDGMFCAGWENGTNVCNGDSGGAFAANVNGSWTAFGIVSFTGVKEHTDSQIPFRCDTKSLAGFISIPMYLDWIESVAAVEAVQLDTHREMPHSPLPRISDTMCQSYRDQCPKQEDVSYLAPIVRPIRVAGSSPRYARLVIDCYGVLISERFLLAPASCHHSTALPKQFIMLEFAGQAMACSVKRFHHHPNFINNPPSESTTEDNLRKERTHQSNIALIELERAVSLSTCQFVCLWTGVEGAESETLPNILLYSAVNVSSGDKSIESSEMTVRPTSSGRSSTTQASRCYDELLAPLVMQQNPDGGRSDRLVGIVVERTCTTIRFIKVAPFLGWIERIVWLGSSSSDNDNGL
ncbi:polyserase-2-like [Anopheles arabiensis]|uniref:Peptidase S1 domain-containing protein n=1 Tax=Anopheles arabiensis TaxID=7173 RepID=A0A182IEG7_ANOAR|nr:polyserase-2-like [Anopheles arabiensis]